MSLVTRNFGPNAKCSKLTIQEMDCNFLYLESLAGSGSSIMVEGTDPGSTLRCGNNNSAAGYYATVSGGQCNVVLSGTASSYPINPNTISGGYNNYIGGNDACANYYTGGNIIGGGACNGINRTNSAYNNAFNTISGGYCNTVSGNYGNTVSGGICNTASGFISTIGGGQCNTASGACYSTIGGGQCNTASGFISTISGGRQNTALCSGATIGGGSNNTASGYCSTIGGGRNNTASGGISTIGGGFCNTASGCYSAILGGKSNNTNSCADAMIVGSCITADRACATFVNNLSIKNIPTSSSGLPVGSVWRNGTVLEIVI